MTRALVWLLLAGCAGDPVLPVPLDAPPDGDADDVTAEVADSQGGLDDLPGGDALPDAYEPDDAPSPPDVAPDTVSDTDTGPQPCPDDLTFFATRVHAPILRLKCAGCHNPAGLAAATDLVLAAPGDPNAVETDFATVSALVPKTLQGVPVLLLRPTGLHPDGHTGGALVPPASADYDALVELVARILGEDPCAAPAPQCPTVEPGPPVLRRLTRAEYDATVESLFGFPSTWGAGFTAEAVVHGFDNNAAALGVTPLLADQLREAAEAIAKKAVLEADIVPCAPAAPGCAAEFIASFGLRAFRRPLTPDDVARYEALFDVAAAEDGFAAGVELTLAAMLQSPHFLYRFELGQLAGGLYTLGPWEVASELSYLLWGTMPDTALFDRAADGTLLEPEVLEAEAARLLEDPRAAGAVDRFAEQWLGIRLLDVLPKDAATWPALTPAVRAAMGVEARRFVSDRLLGGATLGELFTHPVRQMTPALAQFYGLGGSGAVDVTGTSYPGGVLALGAVLTSHAFPTDSSPIHRGKLVRERLLCQELSPPPPGLVAQVPPEVPGVSNRERFQAHMSVEPCFGCHRLMDPIGFGFEHFDGAGRYRADDGGLAIDDAAEILGSPASDGSFDGLGALSAALADSPDVEACFVRQWLRFGYGLEPGKDLGCLQAAVRDGFVDGGRTFEALVLALVRSPHFRTRRDPPEPEPPPTVPDPDPPPGDVVQSPDVPTPSELTHEVVVDSQWDGGSCSQATVRNPGAASATWSLVLPVDGAVTQVWNALHEPEGEGQVRFSGLAWNATIPPGGEAKFGWCAEQGAAAGVELDPEDLEVTVTVDSEWATGFCHSVTVLNEGPETGAWSAELTLPGTIVNLWNAQATLVSGTTYRFLGLAWNEELLPGGSASFGLCGAK